MTTPLYPAFNKRIDDSFDQLIKNQVTPWAFLNSGKPMVVYSHDKRKISYSGIGFEGSPEHVFWGRYIEPFMEEIIVNVIDESIKKSKERQIDATQVLPEVSQLLLAGVGKTYAEMANIDRRLKGKGFPEKINLRSIEKEYSHMEEFIKVRVKSDVEMWKPRPRIEIWYENNKFWVWVVTIVIAVLGLVVKIA